MESRIDAKGIIEKTGAYITAREGDLLSESAKKNPDMGDIVEIGSFTGGSTILLANGSKMVTDKKSLCCRPPFVN
jgi:predicted O-methyltransferase YrrM